MKTTIEFPDVMFRQTKELAAARRVTLERVFTEALEACQTLLSARLLPDTDETCLFESVLVR